MFYLIQKDTYRTAHEMLLFDVLERFGLEYELVRYIPFIGDVEFTTDRKDVFCFGAGGVAKASKKYGWTPGSFLNDNHDLEVYGKYYKDNMLNADGIVLAIDDNIPFNNCEFFVRPTKDLKIFTGQVFTKKSWDNYIYECTENKALHIIKEQTNIFVAPIKHIQQEVRCFIIKGKVVTTSMYKLGGTVLYKNYDNEIDIIEFAEEMAKLYQPAEAFVLDVARTSEGLKVVEINCINAAGFYHINMNKLITALEENFN